MLTPFKCCRRQLKLRIRDIVKSIPAIPQIHAAVLPMGWFSNQSVALTLIGWMSPTGLLQVKSATGQ